MRVLVTGGIKQPVLLDTDKATSVVISSDDGKPNVLFRITPEGRGWIKYVKGEDPEFDDIVKQLI